MLAGRPHEAAGNGSPRWMTAAPRERGTEPGLQAGSPPFMSLTLDGTRSHRGGRSAASAIGLPHLFEMGLMLLKRRPAASVHSRPSGFRAVAATLGC